MSAITKLDNELPHSKLLVHKQPAVTSPPQQQPLQVGRGRFTLRPVLHAAARPLAGLRSIAGCLGPEPCSQVPRARSLRD